MATNRLLRRHARYLPALFKSKGPARPFYDADTEIYFQGDLPDELTVYRGCDERFIRGVSWTLKHEIAKYFAAGGPHGEPLNPAIVTGKVIKD